MADAVFAAGVPATAQGVGEVVVRDVGRALGRGSPQRALAGVSQGAFFVDTFLAEGFDALPGGGRAYDLAITVDGTGNWMAINRLAGAGPQDPYLRADGRPLPYRRLLRRPRTDPLLADVANLTDFHRLRAGLTDVRRPPRGVLRYDWPSPHQSFPPPRARAASASAPSRPRRRPSTRCPAWPSRCRGPTPTASPWAASASPRSTSRSGACSRCRCRRR